MSLQMAAKDKYPIAGKNVSDARWFKAAMSCQTGDDYQWESVHYSDLVNNEPVLIFTTAGTGERKV